MVLSAVSRMKPSATTIAARARSEVGSPRVRRVDMRARKSSTASAHLSGSASSRKRAADPYRGAADEEGQSISA